MEEKNIPLPILLENAKGKLFEATNRVLEEAQLPAYLMEGIFMGVLAEIRQRKNLELVAHCNTVTEKKGEE